MKARIRSEGDEPRVTFVQAALAGQRDPIPLLGRGEEPQVYFFRMSAGTEVDFVVEMNTRLIPIEVKSSATPRPEMAAGIASFRKDFPRQAQPGYVIHMGDVPLPLEPGITAIPFTAL